MREVQLVRVLEPEVMDTEEDAREYDAMDHSEPNGALVARLIELGARGRMLDIGTGPGHIPIMICERIAEVDAADRDPTFGSGRHDGTFSRSSVRWYR